MKVHEEKTGGETALFFFSFVVLRVIFVDLRDTKSGSVRET